MTTAENPVAGVMDREVPADRWRMLAAIAAAAELPGLLVDVDADDRVDACATYGLPCHASPIVQINADLLTGDAAIAAASIAHEMAHLQAQHPRTGWHRWAGELTAGLAGGGVFGLLVAQSPWWGLIPAIVAVVVWVAGLLAYRRREFAADARGVQLLNRAGLNGAEMMRAMLADLRTDQSRWNVVAGWVMTGHPSATGRMTALDELGAR